MPVYDEIQRARERLERRLGPEVADIFAEQGDRIISVVEEAHSVLWAQFEAERIASDPSYAQEALYLVWTTTFPPFATTSYEALEPPVKASPDRDEWLEMVLDFIREEGGEMISAITATQLEDVRRVLREGADEGEGVDSMARALRKTWPELTKTRAERIVRTEVMAASNAATDAGYHQVAKDYGLKLEIEWLTASTGERHPSYSGLNGQRVPLGGTFNVGGFPARYPGDPGLPAKERVNCRCTTVAVEKTKAVGFLDRRDRQMKQAYEPLKAELGSAYQARLELADRHAISERQVRRILWEGGRS